MELHQLRYLSAVAHCGSAAKAAEELYVSKQAVSKAIRSLEHETGFELFDRDDGMRLTENGREILVHAEAVLRELDEIDLYVQAQGAGARQISGIAGHRVQVVPARLPVFQQGSRNPVALIDEFVYRTPDRKLCLHVQDVRYRHP